MAGISNDASLRGKVRAVAKKNGLRAQEVLQMYLFEHLLLRLDWSSIGAPAPSRAPRLPGQHHRRPGPPAGRRLAGARAVDLAGDGRPLPGGARARPTASLGPVRTSRDVPGHTPQALAHSPGVPPAHARPARLARTSPSGSGAPERAHGPARGGAAAGPAGPPLRPVPVVPLAREVRPAAPGARVRLPARPAELGEHLRAEAL